jgi:hypothetical protein
VRPDIAKQEAKGWPERHRPFRADRDGGNVRYRALRHPANQIFAPSGRALWRAFQDALWRRAQRPAVRVVESGFAHSYDFTQGADSREKFPSGTTP